MASKNQTLAIWSMVCLLLFQGALFWPLTTEFFTPDGVFYLARQVHNWNDIEGLFTSLDQVGNYRPLTYIVATALHSWWGLDPFPYHVLTLLAHLGITALVFWLVRLLLLSDIAAVAAAIFFGLHSCAARVAFGITFISDLLYAGFFVFAIIAFLKVERGSGNHWVVISLLSFVFGLFSKEPAITLPAVLTATLLFLPSTSLATAANSMKWRESLKRTLPFWFVALVYLGWFALLTDGRFLPENPAHPYHASFSWENLRSKGQYLPWAINLGRFSTMAVHPTITSLAFRIFPSNLAESFSHWSDFWLYLLGPLWVLWLLIKRDWQSFADFSSSALTVPVAVVSAGLLLRRLCSRKQEDGCRTVFYGALFFIFPLSPVLLLPASKTMLHNLYVPTIGLAVIVGDFVRQRLQKEGTGTKRFMWLCAVGIIVAAGIHAILLELQVGWPTTTARSASRYLEDVQRLQPTLPAGAILYFERTGMTDWPFLTHEGDLFRVFYMDDSLITLFGDHGQGPPDDPDSSRVFRFREMDGTIFLAGY